MRSLRHHADTWIKSPHSRPGEKHQLVRLFNFYFVNNVQFNK